jgi:hypothetical protein
LERGSRGREHVAEVEEYVRHFALRTAHKVLLFCDDDGRVSAVSAFDRVEIGLSGRRRTAAWRLQVVALRPQWRGALVEADIKGCPNPMKASEFVLRKTYERMLELDARRVMVVGRIHDENRASMVACERVGLVRTEREDSDYWRVLGEVDPSAQRLA